MGTSVFQCVWRNIWKMHGYASGRYVSNNFIDILLPRKEINCDTRKASTSPNPRKCFQGKTYGTFVADGTLNPLLSPSKLLMVSDSCQMIPVRTYKMKHHLKRRCKDCYFLTVDDQLLVHCKTHPRHKQKQIVSPEWKKWIITHATQGKKRPW